MTRRDFLRSLIASPVVVAARVAIPAATATLNRWQYSPRGYRWMVSENLRNVPVRIVRSG